MLTCRKTKQTYCYYLNKVKKTKKNKQKKVMYQQFFFYIYLKLTILFILHFGASFYKVTKSYQDSKVLLEAVFKREILCSSIGNALSWNC